MWTHNNRPGHGQEPEVWTVKQISDQSSKLILTTDNESLVFQYVKTKQILAGLS